MRIALAQINPTVGDIAGNERLAGQAIARGGDAGADLVVLPEMVLLGYPQRDLLLRGGVLDACEAAVRRLAESVPDGLIAIIGHPRRCPDGRRPAYNSASICRGGRIIDTYDKHTFPGYDVFDEDRYFEPGDRHVSVEIAGRRAGVLICEDIWQAQDVVGAESLKPRLRQDPIKEVANRGCDLLIVPSASPFVIGKGKRHMEHLQQLAREHGMDIVLVNQVGGNDDLIFDGRSMVVRSDGSVQQVAASFDSDFVMLDLASAPTASSATAELSQVDSMAEAFDALVLGIRDYVRKTGHQRVTIGLSGGIDSAITAVMAVAALGADNVRGIMMPSRYSSPGSLTDAKALADNLGISQLVEIPIEAPHQAMSDALSAADPTCAGGVVDENVQARLRGVMLMACSNQDGSLVLATGNKSELAMGYCTLYGDMCGALAPLGDLYKMQVYEMSRWINEHNADCGFDQPPIPEASITKVPSAELRPDQTDQDTLPPYEVLDEIIRRYIDHEQDVGEVANETAFDENLVRSTCRTIDINEYKRMQAAIVLKVNPRTFGPGRPMPAAMQWV